MATQEQIDALKAQTDKLTDLAARVATLVGEDGMEIMSLKDRVAVLEAAQGTVTSDPATDAAIDAAKVAVEASNAVLDALLPHEAPPAEVPAEAPPVEVPVEAAPVEAAPAEAPVEAAPADAPVEETPAAPAA